MINCSSFFFASPEEIASLAILIPDFIESAFDDESLIPNADTRTNFGKSLNHQKNCNANQKSENNKLNVYACKNIKKGEEITINYNNAPEYVRTAVNTKGYKEVWDK